MKALLLYLYFVMHGTTPPPAPNETVTPYERPAAIAAALDESRFSADIAAQAIPDYVADNNGEILYFSADGRAAEAPVEGGFSRKVLGKTADGRPVVQDYYLESGAPQTGVTELVKDADLTDFSTAILQGRAVWYREDGSIYSHADFKDGGIASPHHYYLSGQLAAQIEERPEGIAGDTPYGNGTLVLQFFHPNGKPIMRRYDLGEKRVDIFYREDGSPIALSEVDSEHIQFWQRDGSAAEMGEITGEYIAIIRSYGDILLTLADGYAEVFRITDGQTPFGENP